MTRSLKTFMKAKKPMWRCGECKCVTLQAWKCADELCGCGEGENSPTAKYTFKDWNGVILKTGIVNDLETPIPPEDPTRESTAQYDYTFDGWEPEIKKITKDTTYTAKYVESVRSYTVTIISNDNTMGTVDESSLIAEYGTALSVNGNVLTIDTVDVTATAEAGYVFSSWGELPATVTEDLTITATFEAETPTEYTLTINCEEGNWLGDVDAPISTITVAAGDRIVADNSENAIQLIIQTYGEETEDWYNLETYPLQSSNGYPIGCTWEINGVEYTGPVVVESNMTVSITNVQYGEGE